MNCKYHVHQEAQSICEKCKQPICSECLLTIENKSVCRHCIQENLFVNSAPIPKRSFLENVLFFCFSLIPGAAHMNLGLFRRGLQLMIITFGGATVLNFIGLDSLIPIILIPTWFFSFFESYHLRKQREKGHTLSDQDLIDRQWFDYSPFLKNRHVIGYSIIIIGVLALLREIERTPLFDSLFGQYYYLIRGSLVPLCLILGGIYLITKAKHIPEAKTDLSDD